MPRAILFLQKLIPRKKFLEVSYISERVCPGGCQECSAVEEVYPKKTCDVGGVSKTTVHHWIVASNIHVHCYSLKPVLTEENKVARLLMALHFRDPLDLMKYHFCVPLHVLDLTLPQILGGMANWGYGQLVIGNQLSVNLRIDLKEHWCGRIKQLLKRFTKSYLYPSCCQLSRRNGPGQTGFQEKIYTTRWCKKPYL